MIFADVSDYVIRQKLTGVFHISCFIVKQRNQSVEVESSVVCGKVETMMPAFTIIICSKLPFVDAPCSDNECLVLNPMCIHVIDELTDIRN